MRTLKTLAVVLLWTVPALCSERFELRHLAQLVRVADPQIAPDGKSIAILVSRPNYADNRYDGQLLLVDVATQSQRVLGERRGRASRAGRRAATGWPSSPRSRASRRSSSCR